MLLQYDGKLMTGERPAPNKRTTRERLAGEIARMAWRSVMTWCHEMKWEQSPVKTCHIMRGGQHRPIQTSKPLRYQVERSSKKISSNQLNIKEWPLL
jgi:hypothetical protein